MAKIEIIRGDSYESNSPMWTHTLVDKDGEPMDLSGCTVLTTYKPSIIPIEEDPDDDTAVIKHEITLGPANTPEVEDGLYYISPGVIEERFSSVLTRTLPPDVSLRFDVQLTDANGKTSTFTSLDTVTAVDSVTNREG